MTPVTRASVDGRALDLVLDTGNQGGTQLWERFTSDFPALVSQGRRSTRQVRQIGGASEQEVVMLADLRLRIGGFDALLQPAAVFPKPVGDAIHHGNVGVDVLGRATEVSIDFNAMSLSLR
jgi:hypothetical protein